MWALLSDIHGNLEALDAILRDAEARGAERIAVLGDTIDYGPDPRACLERVADVAEVWLTGNHEREAIAASPEAEPVFRPLIEWSVTQLEGSPAWAKAKERMGSQGFDGAATWVGPDVHFTHASPRAPIDQYVWPSHECQYVVFNDEVDRHLRALLGEFERHHGFVGHTHVPAVLVDHENHGVFDPYEHSCDRHPTFTFVGRTTIFFVPRGDEAIITGLAGKRMVANPGSAGFPRRVGDPRPSYALYDGDRLELRRIEYNRESTLTKLAALPVPDTLRTMLIERLRTGV